MKSLRFQKRIFVPLPEADARLEMLRIFSRKLGKSLALSEDVDFDSLVKMTQGHSGSDILNNFQGAQAIVVREFFENGNPNDEQAKPRPITMKDFNDVLRVRRPSVDQSLIVNYLKWSEQYQAA